jgi:hypothetical protein
MATVATSSPNNNILAAAIFERSFVCFWLDSSLIMEV